MKRNYNHKNIAPKIIIELGEGIIAEGVWQNTFDIIKDEEILRLKTEYTQLMRKYRELERKLNKCDENN